MKKILFITLIFLFVVTLLIACTTKEIENSNSNNLKEKELPIDTETAKITINREYNIIKENNIYGNSGTIEMIAMDDTIDRNYYSPDRQNYLHEQIHFQPDEYGALRIRNFFINDKQEELVDVEILNLPVEKNFTPNVFWLNNTEVIFGGFHAGTIVLDINADNHKILKSYFGASANRDLTKIVINSKSNRIYIYDLFSEEYKEIYKTNYDFVISEMHLNAVWENNNIIYFDDLILENQRLDEWGNRIYDPKYSIKKYNTETEVTEDFIEHGYILNESPDKRYLTYVDLTKQKTIILDITSDETFEIPLSLELEWSTDSQQLAYIPNQGKNVLYIENLEQEGREVTIIDISSYLDKNKEALNLQYDINGYYTFDIANFKDYGTYYYPVDNLYFDIVTYKVNMPEL